MIRFLKYLPISDVPPVSDFEPFPIFEQFLSGFCILIYGELFFNPSNFVVINPKYP